MPYLEVLDRSDETAELQHTALGEHHPNHSNVAMQSAAKTAVALIMVTVSSVSLDIGHLVLTAGEVRTFWLTSRRGLRTSTAAQ
jgi:hypothetical protein